MEDLQHLQPSKNILNKLQYFLSAAALSLLLNLGMPNQVPAQNKQISMKEVSKDSLEKKEVVDERTQINNLRHAFKKGHYGSDHVIGLLGGKFVGEHGKTIYNNRSLTSAYDYLLLDNALLSLLVNLGFTEDNITFISYKKLPYRQPYKLGYSTYEENKKKEIMSDSAYSQVLKKNIPIKKSFVTNYTMYTVDSSKTVDVQLAGVKYTKKVGKTRVSTVVELPQLEYAGKGTDANNFDLSYEMMEHIYDDNKDRYDITKRQFSSKIPPKLKSYIISNYDRKKLIKEKKDKGEGTGIVYRDTLIVEKASYNEVANDIDIVNQPNFKTFSFGTYQFFKYFTDIYRRDMRFDQSEKNPIWHNAFQNDHDPEQQKNGLIDFIVLPYGVKGYSMPTLMPKQSPGYTQMDGLIIDDGSGIGQESIRTIMLNGRLVGVDRRELPSDKGLFTLFREGVVDRMYRVYDIKSQKTFWMYPYCGVQSGIRGGSIGKLLPEKAIELKNKTIQTDTWHIAKNTSFAEYQQNKDSYMAYVEKCMQGSINANVKTIPNVILPVEYKNPNNPKKTKTLYKELRFLDNTTAIIYPDSLIVGWRIKKEFVNPGRIQRNIQNICIDLLGTTVVLDNLPHFLGVQTLSLEQIQEYNETYTKAHKKEQTTTTANTSIPSTKIEEKSVINEIYKNHIYNLSNIYDNETLINLINNDITDIDYTIKATQGNIQYEKTNKLQKLTIALDKIKEEHTTETQEYKSMEKEYNQELGLLSTIEQKFLEKKNERTKLLKLQQKYYMTYVEVLEYMIDEYTNRINFMNKQIQNASSDMQGLNSNDPVYITKQKIIQQTTRTKNEIEEKKKEIEIKLGNTKKEKQTKQLLIIDEKEAN